MKLEGLFNGIFTPRYNPMYCLGAISVFLMGVLFVTGVYLFIFYRISAPYDSVRAVTEGHFYAGRTES